MTSFHDFGLAESIARALVEEKSVTPAPLQAQTIPAALSRRHLIGIVQSGAGKTATFARSILHRLFADTASAGTQNLPRADAEPDSARTCPPVETPPITSAVLKGRLIFRHKDERAGAGRPAPLRNQFRRR